jgi:hypothetical protein
MDGMLFEFLKRLLELSPSHAGALPYFGVGVAQAQWQRRRSGRRDDDQTFRFDLVMCSRDQLAFGSEHFQDFRLGQPGIDCFRIKNGKALLPFRSWNPGLPGSVTRMNIATNSVDIHPSLRQHRSIHYTKWENRKHAGSMGDSSHRTQ